MKKNLPIKLFKKRDNDKALNNLPVINSESQGLRIRLEGEKLQERSDYFSQYFGGLKEKVERKARKNNYLPTLVKIKLNSEALAKTYRNEIGKIFNKGRKINIIGLIGDEELLIKIDNPNDLIEIESKIKDSTKNVLGLSAIEEANDFSPLITSQVDDESELKVKLVNFGDYNLNEIAERSFQNLCKDLDLEYSKLDYSSDLIIYKVSSIKPLSLINSDNSECIFSIGKFPLIKLSDDLIEEDGEVEIKEPIEGEEYFKIGIFDEGICDIPHLKKWKEGNYIAFESDQYDKAHGTFVAGIINYGDNLEGHDWIGTKPFKITEAVIYPNNNFGYIDEAMMVGFMREAVIKHPEVKVWNFSIGNDSPINDHQYSDFARYLDELQAEYNILIVKSAGNCSNFAKAIPAPRGRITEGSESIKTLVVGSLAHSKRSNDISNINYPSPFSMIGPGCSDVIKPDLVHYGGNVGFMPNGKIDINGVKSFSVGGKISSAVGTSYSAPRVTALASALAGSIKEEFNPDLIKALLIHAAKHPVEFDATLMDRITQIGFGMPSKIEDIIYNDANEVTLILVDSVDKGSNIKIMDFPFPSSLVEDDHFYGQIKITLVTSPEVNSYNGAEYIQSDVDVAFGTYEKKIEVVDSKVKRNPIDMYDAQNLLVSSKYSTIKQKSAKVAFKSDRFLHSYSYGHTGLFIPIKKWNIDLEELQESHKRTSLYKDRLWYLQLKASYRNDFDLRIKDSKDISQEFVMVITIKDTKKKGRVYDEVTQLLTNYNFIHENIRVDERIIIS